MKDCHLALLLDEKFNTTRQKGVKAEAVRIMNFFLCDQRIKFDKQLFSIPYILICWFKFSGSNSKYSVLEPLQNFLMKSCSV